MSEQHPSNKIELPLLSPEPPRSEEIWHGFTASEVLRRPVGDESTSGHAISGRDDRDDAPEPWEPQGEYNPLGAEMPLALPEVVNAERTMPTELLAPAGGMDAGLAAFHFGADAIYLGLKKFSARAEAENFTLEELDEITAYAHSLEPARRVFVTINTLIRQDELEELVEAVAALQEIGVDALIIQDIGVYHLVRRHFPDLELHASTQLSVHNHAGAEALREMGFARVVLARELTFEEVHDITATSGIETEVFIHGALCYSYSGLCLFSSQTLGRSGNRGKCAYSCRDSFEVTGAPMTLRDGTTVRRDPSNGFPFSMRDLALPDHIPALQSAGVSCFKIEGRKKSPLYVATTTEYYRRLIDGTLDADDRPDIESDMQTVFSRPWTRLFVQSHKDKEVADRDTVGHRGTPIGYVEEVIHTGNHRAKLRFRSSRPLQLHDGLQVDLPILGKPFGFPIDKLWLVQTHRKHQRNNKERLEGVFETPADALVEVGLPADHPDLPEGAPVYCSSSQEVKQRYKHDGPKPGLHRVRRSISVTISLTSEALTLDGRVVGSKNVEITHTLDGPFENAKNPAKMEETVRSTFEKLGQTRFSLGQIAFHNPSNLFVPVSTLNQARRELIAALDAALQTYLEERVACVKRDVLPKDEPHAKRPDQRIPRMKQQKTTEFAWSIKVDRFGFLDAFGPEDWSEVDEVLIDIARDPSNVLLARAEQLGLEIGRERIRFCLPPLTRRWEDKPIRKKIELLRNAGWQKWEAANLSAWRYLGLPVAGTKRDSQEFDISADWSLYVINRLAALQLLEMGVSRFTLSPEDGLKNMRSLLSEFADTATVVVYQDTPQFLAESCAYANLIGGCPGKANCSFESMEMESSHGERVTAIDYHCRTIVLNQGAFSLSKHLPELAKAGAKNLRADFVYRKYEPDHVRDVWRVVRQGEPINGASSANFRRGIQ
ncbi:MAG: U32 family peptidase [Gemmataceae bacterium]